MRTIAFIMMIGALGCSDDKRADREPFEGEVPTTSRPFPTLDVGLDLAQRDAGSNGPCLLTSELSGAISGTFEFPSTDATCSVVRTDGTLTATGFNTVTNARFSVALQLKDRGDDEILETGSGPTFEQPEEAGTTIWNAFGEDCSYKITTNDQIAPTTYLMVGDGDCRRRIDPVPGSPNEKDLKFESFTFEFAYDWP